MLVDRDENAAQRLDVHKQVVDNEFDFTVIASRKIVNENHSVESAERMVAHGYETWRFGQIVGSFHGVGDSEMIDYAAAEFVIAFAVTSAQHFVELVLADDFFQSVDQKVRYEAAVARQARA